MTVPRRMLEGDEDRFAWCKDKEPEAEQRLTFGLAWVSKTQKAYAIWPVWVGTRNDDCMRYVRCGCGSRFFSKECSSSRAVVADRGGKFSPVMLTDEGLERSVFTGVCW